MTGKVEHTDFYGLIISLAETSLRGFSSDTKPSDKMNKRKLRELNKFVGFKSEFRGLSPAYVRPPSLILSPEENKKSK